MNNETKIEVVQAIKEFEKEISKENPDLSKLKKLFKTIKDIASFFI